MNKSLQTKIRKLIESMDVNEADQALDNLSDEEIRQRAEAAGLEEMIVSDDEGGLANRDEIIQALEAIELNQTESVVTEADDEEKEDAPEELPLEDEEPLDPDALEDLPREDEEPAEEPEEEEEPTPEEEEADVTVVVVSPEFKKEEEEEDEEGKIDTNSLFGESLSAEEQDRLKTVFEAAVKAQVKRVRQSMSERYNRLLATETKKLAASHTKALEEAKKAAISESVKLVDGFMSETTEQWMVENAVQLEQNVRAELTEQFIDGLKVLFKEHYIEVPEEKFDLVKAQEEKIRGLEESVAKAKAQARRAIEEAADLKCQQIVAEATEGMTDVARARFEELVEQVDVKSVSQFEKRVQQIAESVSQSMKPTRQPRRLVMERVVEQKPAEEQPLGEIERLALQIK